MKDISVNNAKFVITIGIIPVVIDNFSTESDMWSVAEVEAAELEVTPDGKAVRYAKNFPITATLTLNGASDAGKNIRDAIKAQSRNGSIDSVILPVSVVITEANGSVTTYLDGAITNGLPAKSFGNQKLLDQTFTFKFQKVIEI